MAQEDVYADIYAEPAEEARNEAENAKLAKQNDVKLADLNNKFVVIKDITDYGDLFVDDGNRALVFGVKDNDIYKLNTSAEYFDEQVADPTQGELVVELDSANNKINWKQDHVEQQPFESFNSLRSSEFIGDAGYPLLQALEAYIHGTYNISGYDTRLVSAADLVADLEDNASPSTPASSSSTSSSTPASSGSSSSPASSSTASRVAKAASSSASQSAASGANSGASSSASK